MPSIVQIQLNIVEIYVIPQIVECNNNVDI